MMIVGPMLWGLRRDLECEEPMVGIWIRGLELRRTGDEGRFLSG